MTDGKDAQSSNKREKPIPHIPLPIDEVDKGRAQGVATTKETPLVRGGCPEKSLLNRFGSKAKYIFIWLEHCARYAHCTEIFCAKFN